MAAPLPSLWAAADAYSASAPESVIKAAGERATKTHDAARKRYQSETNSAEAAWLLGRACFDCADMASDNSQRSQFAQEGIRACQAAIRLSPKSAAAYYYLGLNQGQLARTRKLSALGIIQDIEQSWQTAIRLDEKFDFAGPHRSIGILYRDAPGWPLSIGDRAKAKQHLKKAVELAPSYPDNQICWLESQLDWGEKQAVRSQAPAVEKLLEEARLKFQGEAWELSWHDWKNRWESIKGKAAFKAAKSPRQGDMN